jgi:acyl-CoA thioesterase
MTRPTAPRDKTRATPQLACEATYEELQSVVTLIRNYWEIGVSDMTAVSSRKLARACADFLWAHDATLRGLGLEWLSIEPGHAEIAMMVLPAMVNGIGITHGGAIFTLADTAFSLAANSYNERTVAAHCSIAFLQPTRLGDRLVASAREVVRTSRHAIYDIRVSLVERTIAEFRAHARVIGGTLLPQQGTLREEAAMES